LSYRVNKPAHNNSKLIVLYRKVPKKIKFAVTVNDGSLSVREYTKASPEPRIWPEPKNSRNFEPIGTGTGTYGEALEYTFEFKSLSLLNTN